MTKVYKNDLENLLVNNGIVKEYRASLHSLHPPSDHCDEYRALAKQLISATILEESLEKANSAFIQLRKYYSEDTGFYKDSICLEAHAFFTHGALLYRAGFVKGGLVKRPSDNLPLNLNESQIHILLRDYIDKKIAHADINHDMKSRDIGLSLKVKEDVLEVGNVCQRGEEVHSYPMQTLEAIISHISNTLNQVTTTKKEIIQKIRSLIGSVSIEEIT